MERIGPLTTEEETALEALKDWLNTEKKPNRSVPDSFSLRVSGWAGEAFHAAAAKLVQQAAYEHAEFRREEYLDKDGTKHILTYLDGRKLHCVRRKTA